MKAMTAEQRFWIAVMVVGGYLAFGAATIFIPHAENATIFINTVFSTMGPLVGWVVKGLFDAPGGER